MCWRMWPFSWPLPTGVCPPCAEDPRPAALQVRSHKGRESGQNLLPWPAGHKASDAAQDAVGFLGYVPTKAGSCSAFHLLMIPNHPRQGCSQPLQTPACIDGKACPDLGTGPCLLWAFLYLIRLTWAQFLTQKIPHGNSAATHQPKLIYLCHWNQTPVHNDLVIYCLTVITNLIITFSSQTNS